MYNFYPGPSKIYPHVGPSMQTAFESGILAMNHRSADFMQMMEQTIGLVKVKLNVPDDYEVFFVSSATESWEIITQSFSDSFFHYYNGAFGQKWMEYAARLKSKVTGKSFEINELPSIDFANELKKEDLICLTHNETSNGSALPSLFLKTLRSTVENIIAVDATSSMAGADLPWETADIWFASVQKCFGLPAGLAVMVVSPSGIGASESLGDDRYYNSFNFMRKNFLKYQTPYTPNILGIYLLGESMKMLEPIKKVSELIDKRADSFYDFLQSIGMDLIIKNPMVRSDTVLAVGIEPNKLIEIKRLAHHHNIILGNGYGDWKNNSFRLANFPAICDEEYHTLKLFLTNNF